MQNSPSLSPGWLLFRAAPFVATLLIAASALADSVWKRISPAGLRRGTTAEVEVVGDDLKTAKALHFADDALAAEKTAAQKFRVTANENAAPGPRLVWLETENELLGPRIIDVDFVNSLTKSSTINTPDEGMELATQSAVDARFDGAADVDWYRVTCQANSLLTVAARSVSLGSDAIVSMTLIDPNGREIAHTDGRALEPIVHAQILTAGVYNLRVTDRSYAVSDYAFYRLRVLSGPVIRHIHPHILPLGAKTSVQAFGYGLPGGSSIDGGPLQRVEAEGTAERAGVAIVGAARRLGVARTFKAAGLTFSANVVDSEHVAIESSEPNERQQRAQTITLPTRLIGQFGRGDTDWFQFELRKGQSVAIETAGEQLGQRMDIDVAVHAADGKLLKSLTDATQPKGVPAAWNLASLDARGDWQSPADGVYSIAVRDLHSGSVFGPHRIYELSLREAQPSFEAAALLPSRASPRGLHARREGAVELSIAVHRKHGFAGAVEIELLNPPAGVSAEPGVIETKKIEAKLNLNIAADAVLGLHQLQVVAKEKADEEPLVRNVSAPAALRAGENARVVTLSTIPLLVADTKAEAK
jgi:hypothetical protein